MNDRTSARYFEVSNRTRGTVLGNKIRVADTPRARRRGLLSESSLEPGSGMWIFPSQAIHTFWMRFAIDVVFLDRRLRVKRVYHRMPPFRLSRFVWGAQSVLELSPGVLADSGTETGDELQFLPRNL